MALTVAGCGVSTDPQTLTLANSNDIRGFDPAQATDIFTGQVMAHVYDNLVRFDKGTDLVPGLAKEWSVSDDGLEYIFHLESKARFHDGSPVTAKDVVFSFQRVLDPKTASPQTWLFDRIVGAEARMGGDQSPMPGLRAANDSTLVITLNKPFAPFIQYLAMPSAAVVNQRQLATILTNPAGSGPWKLSNWERDGEIVFIRNQDYWGNAPRVLNLRIRILTEAMARTAEFEAGKLDILDVPDMELAKWKARKEWGPRIQSIDELSTWYVGMNCSRPPFNDVRVRRAMNLALDREKILKLLLANTGTLVSGPVPPTLLSEPAPEPYPFDPMQARELLKEAGYENGFPVQLWAAGGSELFHVLEAFQSYWQAVGINVELLRSDWNVFKTAVLGGKPDLYYLDWYADYPDGENFLYPLFHSSESMTKRNRYSNPEVDRIIEIVQALPRGPEREELIVQANQMIFDDAPWVFLWHSQTNVITQPRVHGYEPRIIFNAQRYTDISLD